MKYVPTPAFSEKLSRATSDEIATIAHFVKYIEGNTKDSILSANVHMLSDEIYSYRTSGEMRIFFSLAPSQEEEYLVLLDWISRADKIDRGTSLQPYRLAVLLDLQRNPLRNVAINPGSNGQLNPKFNGQINPKFNGQINPQFNGQINPKFNGQLNYQFNSQINPNWNSAINPAVNWTINPVRNSALGGPFIYSLNSEPEGFIVKVNPSTSLAFDLHSKFLGIVVRANDNVLCRFDTANDWIEYWVETPKQVNLRFSNEAEWIGFVG